MDFSSPKSRFSTPFDTPAQMDYQNRVGGKTGTGGLLSQSEANAERRERLRRLALETIDLSKDPYFMKNHLGTYECRLCLTIHTNEGSYLAHTQGKKHSNNLGRRAAREAAQNPSLITPVNSNSHQVAPTISKKSFIKIGRPGYKIIKIRDPSTKQFGLLFQVNFSDIKFGEKPRHRIMSAFEQRVEAPNKLYQYLIIACEPYETISFKVPAKELDRSVEKYFSYWDPDTKIYLLQLLFKTE